MHSNHKQAYSHRPRRVVRSSDVQTILSSVMPRNVSWLQQYESPILFDAGRDVTGYDGDRSVRLMGYFSPAVDDSDPNEPKIRAGERGLVMTLHGWTGCSHSTYNIVMTDMLVRSGFDVVRLNMRDHGPGIHVIPEQLNTGVFVGTLLEEVAAASRQVGALAGDRPFYIVGASMGGNFAMRMAALHHQRPIPNLRHVIAISPAINPSSATDAIDAKAPYRFYFRRNWYNSLRRKEHLFPQFFNFSALENYSKIRDMTRWLVRNYSGYADVNEYFAAYTVRPESFETLDVPLTVLTARDDNVIPVEDFAALPPHPLLDIRIHDYGGHVGFADVFPFRHRLPQMVLEVLDQDQGVDSLQEGAKTDPVYL